MGCETKNALIVVRTYPTPAKNGVEVSCTAAITDKSEWLRIFPVPWRYLERDKRFRRYQWIDVSVTKAKKDNRPESYRIDGDAIKIMSRPLGTQNAWQARKNIVDPMRSHCLCCLMKERDAHGFPTLGVFRPKSIARLIIKPESPQWTDAQLQILRQASFFEKAPRQELEKIPFSFHYEFRCDHDSCNGHNLTCTDWEMGESYRKWRRLYGDEWEDKFRQRFATDMIEKYDTHFYVGTVHQYPKSWIICGLFYPPQATVPMTLFPLNGAAANLA
jgi:hypothetical protein